MELRTPLIQTPVLICHKTAMHRQKLRREPLENRRYKMVTQNSKVVQVSFEAVTTEQDSIRLYVGVAKAKDLIQVTKVDPYNPKLSPTDANQGYQRPPERGRITRIGRYLIEQEGGGLFPTAVLLASRSPIDYDKKQGMITISSEKPLQIVDGQHRLAGLQYVITEKSASQFENYNIPFVIMETPDRMAEMTQFRIVNGTAKQVRTDLVNMILTATYSGMKRTDIPNADLWKIVVSNVVERLAKDPESPWRDSITLPGETTTRGEGGKIIRATSFITSLHPVYVWFKETGILTSKCHNTDEEIEYIYRIVADYWRALKQVVPEAFENPSDYVIQKTPGLFSLHKLLRHLLHNLYQGRRAFDVSTFVEFLRESSEIKDPNFWATDAGRASAFGSMKGFDELYEIISSQYVI
jgi:DGQHR domain-containing protein